jgi:hypothetical protein
MRKTMKIVLLTAALLCSFGARAAGDDDECKSDIKDASDRAALIARAARFAGSDKIDSVAAKALLADARKQWNCSKDYKSHCCDKVPVDIWVDGTACFASLPYGKLAVSTESGTKKPTVTWELRVEKSADQLFKYKFQFDPVAGIRLLKKPGAPLPAQNGGHGGSDMKFKLDSTGVINAEAGHEPRVFPKKSDGSLDPQNECTPWDPTITNTN